MKLDFLRQLLCFSGKPNALCTDSKIQYLRLPEEIKIALEYFLAMKKNPKICISNRMKGKKLLGRLRT